MKITSTWEYWKRTPSNELKEEKMWTPSNKLKERKKADTIKRAERKKKQQICQTNRNTFQNQVLQQKSYQSDNHLGGPLCHLLGAIRKMDKIRIHTNGPMDKKIHDDEQCLTSEIFHRQIIRGSLNMFPDFFRMCTFIDSTHMKL